MASKRKLRKFFKGWKPMPLTADALLAHIQGRYFREAEVGCFMDERQLLEDRALFAEVGMVTASRPMRVPFILQPGRVH